MKALIFGISGQDGFYLNELLINIGIEVIGVSSKKNSIYKYVDLKNYNEVNDCIRKIKPDFIFCLSAISKTSHEIAFLSQEIVCKGTLNILESVKNNCSNSKVFVPGSALQFKLEKNGITENNIFSAQSTYSVDRIYTYYLSKYYREKFRLPIYYGFLFHHDSPYRSDSHLTIKIISAIKNLKENGRFELFIENLNYTKEFNHAKDIINGIWKFMNQSKYHEIVIGSGEAYSIKEFIMKVAEAYDIEIHPNLVLGNYGEKTVIKSNPRILKSIGWKAEYNIDILIKDIMDNKF